MSTASAGIRTYGKRSAIKRKQTIELVQTESQVSSIKRRKISPDAPDTEESKPKVKVTYGSPRKQASQAVHSDSSPKPARDLSRIFDSITPASPSPSPSKLAKRMLSRSKTESSIESQTSVSTNSMDRTPSLPIFPSPSKSEIFNSPKPVAPLLPLLAPGVKSTRTYATKFRRILEVPLSAAGDPLTHTVAEDAGFEFDAPESYTSLRTRWGVDNSEDDPYPHLSPSPTKSSSATPDVSPSRAGKGKSRSNIPTVRPPPIPAGMMNPLKSISELRNKGESRRFLDEVGYLFEGMDKRGGIGLRRASALEVTTKLCDPDFTRKAKAADFFSRTWEVFLDAGAGIGEDKVLDVLLAFFVSLVARDLVSLLELAERQVLISPTSPVVSADKAKHADGDDDSSLVGILFRLLQAIPQNLDPLLLVSPQNNETDADLKKAGINKKDKLILTTVYKTVKSKSRLFFPNTPISMSLLVTYSLQSLPPHLIPATLFPTFLSSLRLSLAPSSTSLLSTLSLHWMDAVSNLPFETVYYHLRLMDTYLLDQWGALSAKEASQTSVLAVEAHNEEELNMARDSWLAEDFIALGVCIELAKGNEDTSDMFPIQKCLDTTLRVLVSLTHSDEHWGRKVVRSEYTMGFLMRTIARSGKEFQGSKFTVKEEEGMDNLKREESAAGPFDDKEEEEEEETDVRLESYALDTLCLALGLLTNLVQIVEEAKDTVRETRLNSSCPLKKRTCARKCGCPQPKSGIEILAELYAQQTVKAEPSSSTSSPQHQKSLAVEDTLEAHAEADASFLRGHLAVLFGLLMVGSPINQAMILAALPSARPSTTSSTAHVNGKKEREKYAKRAKLARLVEQAKDFAVFYTVISNHMGGEKESKVAREVVRFLEAQRDSAV